MTTLLLCPELFARESGIQRTLRLYLKALCEPAEAGDAVRLVVLNDGNLPAAQLARYAGDKLTAHHACDRRKVAFVRAALRAAKGADRLVCGHIGQLPVAWLARRLRPRLDYFLVAHGIEVWRPYTWIERMALRRARRVLCVSDFTRREMQRRIVLADSHWAVVPNALDPGLAVAVANGTTAPAEPVILTVARLDAAEGYKGVDHLIAALPAIRETLPAARLRVIGTGDDLPRLKQLAGQLGVAAAVEFAGPVDDETLRKAYQTCRLFALPSRGEGFGIVFLEAMAQGRPCLGARAGAVPEIIDATAGVLVEYSDTAQIARQVVWALQQPWNAEQIKQRAAQFSYPIFARRLHEALAA
ncbi:MAG TPA: glycosyltransferase family 4 protein [Opitutaceae bacterium]|nr:glycosyltransferase family 4 protein [Opitutaceae bacterium]